MLTLKLKRQSAGFTIVELLIVIVVIAILAAISLVAYNGVQGRARDSQRLSDMRQIKQAIEMYRLQFGEYPVYQPLPSDQVLAGWEVSTRTDGFLNILKDSGVITGSVPLDPTNTRSSSIMIYTADNYVYFYHRYAAGGSCDPALGHYYVLGVARFDTVPKGTSHPSSPGFSCPAGASWAGRTWATTGAWVTGGFLHGPAPNS